MLNRTTNALTTIRGDEQHTTELTLAGPGSLPARTDGTSVPVTVSDDRHVYVVDRRRGARLRGARHG